MAVETVDTRVVEAKFDSKQFEQGVDRTVKKLDELKKNLELKNTGKSITEFASKTQEATENASKSLEKLNDRFTSFTGMLKQKFLSGIADEIVGVFFKIKSGFENLVSSLSTAQISHGLDRYTEILTSVRTLTAAGVAEDSAYSAIERLGEYADQTSYNLEDLVSTMSKFKTAGASLTTAQRMVEGLSNAAASMGVNAQQASRAYLNMQQAYSKGAMLQNDWISFESLPMVGEKFNQAILDAAVRVGTLKETTKGVYQTVKNIDKQVKTSGADAKGITAQNLGTKLSSRWFNKAVMEEVFGNTYYFEDISRRQLQVYQEKEEELKDQLRKGEITKEEYDKQFNEFFEKRNEERLQDYIKTLDSQLTAGKEKEKELKQKLKDKTITQEEYNKAMKETVHDQQSYNDAIEEWKKKNFATRFQYESFTAGQEARSFTDVINTLKDAISRGWAQSFEYLFGRLDEAKEFFTSLTEGGIADAIYAIGEFRNAVLKLWHGEEGDENSGYGMLMTALNNIKEIIDEILGQFTIFGGSEEDLNKAAENMSAKIMTLTRRFKDFTIALKEWLEEDVGDGVKRYERIGEVFRTLSQIISGAFTAIDVALNGTKTEKGEKRYIGLLGILSSFKPILSSVWGAIKKVLDPIQALFNPSVDDNGRTTNAAYKGVLDGLTNVKTIAETITPVLTKVIDVIGDVAGFFIGMSMDTITMNIQFFSDALGFLMELIFGTSSQKENGTGVIEGVVNDINSLGETCKEALSSVKEFFESLFNDIKKLLGIGDDNPGTNVFSSIQNWFDTNEFIQKVKAWVDQAVKDVSGFIADMPNRITKLGITIGDFFKPLFYNKTSVANTGATWVKKPILIWFENLFNTIKEFFNNIPEGIKKLGITIGDFFKPLFYYKSSVANTGTTWVKKPITLWIESIVKKVKTFVLDIATNFKKYAIDFFDFIKSIFYYKTSVGNTNKTTWVKKPITVWIESIFNTVKSAIVDFIKNIPTYIGTGVNFLADIIRSILGIDNNGNASNATSSGINLSGILDYIKSIGRNITNGIISIFTGDTDWVNNKNWLATKVSDGITWIKEKASIAWESVKDFIVKLPENISNLFNGNTSASGQGSPIWESITGFASSVGVWISEIPNTLLQAWKSAETAASGLWDSIINWIAGGSSSSELKGKYKDIYDDFMESPEFLNPKAQEDVMNRLLKDQWREDNPVAANIEDFFKNLIKFLGDKIMAIPGDIESTFKNIGTIVTAISHVLTNNVDPKLKEDDPVYNIATNTFESIKDWFITNKDKLVGIIKDGWDKAVTIGSIIGEVLFGDGKPVYDQKEFDRLYSIAGYGDSLAKAYKESTKDYGVYNGIASFFENIKNWVIEEAKTLPSKIAAGIRTAVDFAKQVGPAILEGLQSVLTWVTGKVNKVTETIDNVHAEGKSIFDIIKEKLSGKSVDGKEITDPTEKTLWNVVQDIGKSLKTFIVDTIPKFISSAFEEIKMDLPKLINKIFGSDESSNSEDIPKEIGNDVTGYAQKQYEDYVKTNAKKNKSLLDQIIDLLIPSASADELEDVSKEATGKAEQQQEQDKKTLIDKIKDKLSGFGGIIDIIKGVSTAVGSFLSSDIGKYLLLGLVISSILSTIADIMSLTDEVNALKDKSKWDAIKVAVLGLIAIIGYISYLAATDTNQLATTKQALYDLADALQKILAPIEIIMGIMAAGKLGDALGKFFEWREEKVKSKNDSSLDDDESLSAMKKWGLDRAGSLIDKVEDTLLGPAKKLLSLGATAIGGEWIGSMFEMISGNINDAMGEFGSGMSLLSTNIVTVVNNLNSVSSELTTAIDTLGPIKTLFIEMVGLISTTFDKEEINEAGNIETTKTSIISEMGTANKAFTELSGSLSLFKNSVSGYGEDATAVSSALEKILGSKGSMKDFADFVNNNSKDWETFKKALTSLGAIFHLYSNSLGETFNEKPKDLNIENAVEFLNKLFGNEKFKSLIITFSESTLPEINNKNVENAENIIIFAASLSAIAKACAEIKGDEATSINTLFEVINQVKIGKDDKEIQSVAQKFGILGNALGSFALNTAGLTMENLQNAERALRMLTTISVELGKTPDDSWFSKFIYGDKGIDVFSIKISEVGQNLKVFFDSIDALDANGQSRTYNPVNLESVFEVLDVFTKAAQRLSPKYFDDQTFSYFTSFLGVLTKETLTSFAENINAFLKEISKLNDNGEYNLNNNDFEYIDKVVSYINSLSIIVKRVSSLQFTNLGDLDEIVPENNPLVKYISKIMDGMNLLGLKLPAYEQGLGYIKKYQVELQMYTTMVSDIVKIMSFSRKGLALSSEETAAKITDVVNAIFGWNTKDWGIENHHEGVFEKVLGFLNSTKEYEESLEETSSVTKSKDIFMGISDMISGFTRAISDIAKADSVAGIHGFIQSEYSSYVTKLAGVLQSMLDNKQVFVDFFNFGGQFNSAYVKNISMITDTLNSMVQMIATLHSLGPGGFNVESIEDLYDWPHLFDVITDLIMGDNQDFFSPKIAPVITMSEADQLLLSRIEALSGLAPSMTLSLAEGIDIATRTDFEGWFTDLSGKISTMDSHLSNMRFVVNGSEIAHTIYPDISAEAARQELLDLRTSGKR